MPTLSGRGLGCVCAGLFLLTAMAAAEGQYGQLRRDGQRRFEISQVLGPPSTSSQPGDAGEKKGREQQGQTAKPCVGEADQACGDGAHPEQKTIPQLPDAPSEAIRLTTHEKFETFLKQTYSPYTFASAAVNATWAQMWGDWYGYGGGMEGWSKRFGASLANAEVRSFFSSFALPVVFSQDPRYHPSHKRGLIRRSWYAGTRTVITRGDDGNQMFNYSEVLGVVFTASIQNSYYPRRDRGFSDTLLRFTGGLSSDATTNLLREFSPELKRAARKVIPKRAQRMEKRLPEQVRRGINLPH